ncbi:hypothetical protein B0T19DRAFT_364937 [Cercophora scortea]|uniref:Polyketide synthase n=1 Tax=Cercophora scortea TaxID=314031 RepID=A0AAE0J3V5_9PEZI|nr:hypothetical protein B0T19DRAFT_364937 [Cercophora scortea]
MAHRSTVCTMEPNSSPESLPIAVVGMACRFPGGASSPEKLWHLLSNGQNAFREFPQDRLNIDGFYHPDPGRSDGFHFKGAHFINENVAAFDAKFFGIAPGEANAIDPQQRLLLEIAYEATENAGIPMASLQGTNTSVFIGSFVKDYEQVSMRDSQTTAPDCATGNGIAIMANRISHLFDLQGTSQTIDTGCSASLVCVHQAVNSLRSNQSDIAMAGGAGLILTPSTIMPMVSLGFLSKDGKCFTFDSRANGYGRGEGVGIVILKRLDDAIRDNDTIRAVIRGTASNQDGHTPGITVPNPEAQVRCIEEAYRNAKLSVDETGYVECHGTGTKVGDWRELKAISEGFGKHRPVDDPIIVGSVKPNIGHLEGSAGIAGLIKAILISEKGLIPPHINFENWNPDIKHKEWKVDVARYLSAFPSHNLRRISVNCFGFGGTNAHAVLDDARSFLGIRGLTAHHNTEDISFGQCSDEDSSAEGTPATLTPSSSTLGLERDFLPQRSLSITSAFSSLPYLFVFSTQHASGLSGVSSSHIPYLLDRPSSPTFLRDYSYTMYSRRSRLQHRAFIVANSTADLSQKMSRLGELSSVSPTVTEALRPAMVFCGQGAQWPRMGMELMNFAVFRESIAAADDFIRTLDRSFHLLAELSQTKSSTRIHSPRVAQPATTAIQVALVDLLAACKIRPVAVVGHSSGEIAAAYAAGFITRENAWTLAFHRGRCAADLKRVNPTLRGRMIAVGLSKHAIQKYVNQAKAGSITVACINSPHLVTLSGDEDAILDVKFELDRRGVFNTLLAVETAYHSRHMDLVSQQYLQSIDCVMPQRGHGNTVMYSSVHGRAVLAQELDPLYWVTNLVSPVHFYQAVVSMMAPPTAGGSTPNIFIELSPHGVWPKAFMQILDHIGLRHNQAPYFSALTRGRDAVATILELAGDLFLRSHSVDLEWYFRPDATATRPKCLVDIPAYPWDHSKTFWHESHLSRAHRFRQYGRRDYIGAPTVDAVLPYEPRWRGFFRVSENPWILDHKVQKQVLYPAAGMVVMAIEAASQVVHDYIDQPSDILDFEVSQFEIKAPMIVPTGDTGLEHCMNAKRIGDSSCNGITTWTYDFTIFSTPYNDPPFQENARGHFTVRFYGRGCRKSGGDSWLSKPVDADRYQECQSSMCGLSPFEFYEGLDVVGMNYGPSFRNIVGIGQTKTIGHENGKKCWVSIEIPDTKAKMPKQFEFGHIIHPCTLDAVFQSVFTLGSDPMVPFFIDSIRIAAHIPSKSGTRLYGLAKGASSGLREASANIDMWHHAFQGPVQFEDRHVISVRGLRAMSIPSATSSGLGFLPSHRNLCSKLMWMEDVRYASFSSLEGWINILGHKIPSAAILHLGGNLEILSTVFRVLTGGTGSASNTPRLASYTIGTEGEEVCDTTLDSTVEKHRHLLAYEPLTELLRSDASRRFDLVILEATNTCLRKEVENLVATCGFVLALSSRSHCNTYESELCSNRPGSCSDSQKLESVGMAVRFGETGALQLYRKPASLRHERFKDQEVIIILPHPAPTSTANVAEHLHQCLSTVGLESSIKSHAWLNTAAPALKDSFVISLLELGDEHGLVFHMNEKQYNLVKGLLQHSRGLLWVTQGAQVRSEAPRNAPFLGWARTVRSESSQKRIVCLDLQLNNWIQDAARTIQTIFVDSFFPATESRSQETEYAVREGRVYIPRLSPMEELSSLIEQGPDRGLRFEARPADCSGEPLKLEIGSPGNIDSLYFSADRDVGLLLKPDEVRIRVHRTFLFPTDLETVLGKTAETAIGVDVIGAVIERGVDVEQFTVGEMVVALSRDTVRHSVVVQQTRVMSVPTYHRICSPGGNDVMDDLGQRETKDREAHEFPHISWSISAVFTAHCSIKGMKIDNTTTALVYAAAGVLGLAAVAVLRHLGARIIAVVSDGDRKRIAQSVLGIDDRYVVCEGLNLTDRVQELAKELGNDDGRVNLVFDPMPTGHNETNLSCVATHGRVFQVISSSADWSTCRLPRRSFDFVRFDLYKQLDQGLKLDSDFTDLYDAVTLNNRLIETPDTGALFSFGQAGKALKQMMEKGSEFGTYLLQASPEENIRIGYRPIKHRMDIDPEAVYIIVGGFGGLGLTIAEWLAERGAGHIALVSRSGAPKGKALTEKVHNLAQSSKIQVYPYELDICSAEQVEIFSEWLESKKRKVKGVIHAAGALMDFTYQKMRHQDWNSACQVKTIGSWNLHWSLPKDMDFFVFLSSAAGVIGNRGQANYAAGNAFQDALARHRTAHGMHTVSLDLGPIIGAGMVDQDMMDHLRSVGFFGIRIQDMLFVLERAIAGFEIGDTPMPPQVVMGVGTGGLIEQNKPADPFWADTALFAHLNRVDITSGIDHGEHDADGSSLSSLNLKPLLHKAGTVEEAVEVIMEPLITAMVSIIPNIEAADIKPHMTPTQCHSDSMRGVNIDNWLKRTTGVSIGPALNSMSLAKICEEVVRKGGFVTA